MDFLDESFASPNQAVYNQFLGLGNEKSKATAQNSYEQDLLNRFPFSLDCTEQKRIVQEMMDESAKTLEERNSAKKNSSYRNDLTGKLRAFDAYIPEAKRFLNEISCAGNSGQSNSTQTNPVQTTLPATTTAGPTDPVLNGAAVAQQASFIDTKLQDSESGIKKLLSDPKVKTYGLFGLGLLAAVGLIMIIKRRT